MYSWHVFRLVSVLFSSPLTRDRPSQVVEGDEIFPCLLHFTPLKSDWTSTQTPVEWRIEFTEQIKHLYGFRSSSIPVWSMTQHKHTVNKSITGMTDHSKHCTHSNCKKFWKFLLKILNLTDYLLCRFRMFHAQGCCCIEKVSCDLASPFSEPKPVSPYMPVGHTGTRPVCFANHKKKKKKLTFRLPTQCNPTLNPHPPLRTCLCAW